MALPELQYTKSWLSPSDFPTDEPSEEQVRSDMQLLHTEARDYINDDLLPYLASTDAAGDIGAQPFGDYTSTTVQGLIEETTNTLQGEIDDIVGGFVPDNSIDTAKIKNGAVTAEKIASGVIPAKASAAEALAGTDDTKFMTPAKSNEVVQKVANGSMVRDLNIMLNLSLATSNIDAWADLLADATRINAAASSGYVVGSGKVQRGTLTVGPNTSSGFDTKLGDVTANTKVGQSLLITSPVYVETITVNMKKTGSPADAVIAKIYAADKTTLIATSTNTITSADLTTSFASKVFNFSGTVLLSATNHFVSFERTGAIDGTNYFTLDHQNPGNYADGSKWTYNGTTWTDTAHDLRCQIYGHTPCSVVWNAVTPTAPIKYVAVVPIQTLGTGSITYYVSDDGTNWIQITALNNMQLVSFDTASVYLKAVITGDATIDAVAWGGY